METSDTLVIMTSDRQKLLASGRVIDMDIDRSKVQILIENPAARGFNFYLGERCWFELMENEDGTYEALYLRRTPGTTDGVIPQLCPRFIIGGALPSEEAGVPAQEQAALF